MTALILLGLLGSIWAAIGFSVGAVSGLRQRDGVAGGLCSACAVAALVGVLEFTALLDKVLR